MKSTTISIIVIFLFILLGAWYYYSDLQTKAGLASGTTNTSLSDIVQPASQTATSAPQENFTITAYNFGFAPNTITVTKGDNVNIELQDQGGLHNFVIDELGVQSARIDANGTTSVEFNASVAGTFSYYSSVGNDQANGMSGTLTVTP